MFLKRVEFLSVDISVAQGVRSGVHQAVTAILQVDEGPFPLDCILFEDFI